MRERYRYAVVPEHFDYRSIRFEHHVPIVCLLAPDPGIYRDVGLGKLQDAYLGDGFLGYTPILLDDALDEPHRLFDVRRIAHPDLDIELLELRIIVHDLADDLLVGDDDPRPVERPDDRARKGHILDLPDLVADLENIPDLEGLGEDERRPGRIVRERPLEGEA